ncbi:hypothetical protein AB205_0062650 [Aquarana catesbeiana]|uniref:Uncharacterized protein n=1 Tax=Aquarana catesbeiana TaxID=8400 RepID=A0A2G9QBV3_AQUCT|nr:hypothetical protein AB205_0062650 [Aquarana catesbeiana]
MCENCPKKASIPALVREKIMSSALDSAKTDNCTPLPNKFHIPISGLKYLCAKYTFSFILIGEQRLGKYEDTRGTKVTTCGGRRGGGVCHHNRSVSDTTDSGDVQVVVPKSSDFTSDSAQRMIQEITFCSADLDIIKEKTKDIEQRLKNMIDELGRI